MYDVTKASAMAMAEKDKVLTDKARFLSFLRSVSTDVRIRAATASTTNKMIPAVVGW